MANGLVINLEVGRARHTEVMTQDRVRIGTGEGCDLRFQPEAFKGASSLVLELAREDGHYRVTDFDPRLPLRHNGRPISTGAVIDDGDKVQLPESALTLRFFIIDAAPAPSALVPEHRRDVHVAPFIEHAALEASATTRRDDAKVFLREFTRELVREINVSTKVLVFLFALALVGGSLYLGFAGFKELKQGRRRLEEQNAEIARLNDQVRQSQQQFTQVTQSNRDIINSLSLAPKIRSEYGGGVCLISGVYVFVESGTGRPLRYPETRPPDSLDPAAADAQAPLLTPDGRGAVAEFPYVGTGFHVGGGFILTNRHVAAEPWQADERSMVFGSTVSGRPKLTRLVAYFPGLKQAVTLRVKQVSQRDDIAVCQIDGATVTGSLPVLLLDENSDAATVGKPVVLMGYPSGPDRILASLPDEDSAAIKQRYGSSLDVLVTHLAERNLIKPFTSQGHVADVETHRIVYDARTSEGGSGAPLFGQSGRVIGVNFAVFTEISDANFAVPVRFAIALLEKAGWAAPLPAADASSSASASKETKTAAVNSNQSR
ncbi:MAG TPA: trypsin-like peptidase domain-containing protein [Pyrinomonadaceae bacterium]|nr:trypsin-like peptidase domain-containing protein [Pyrinomonadaceae bacterium]